MYYTPNGRSIQVTGVKPDHIVENVLPEHIAANPQRGIREENLRGHLDNTTSQETSPTQVQSIQAAPNPSTPLSPDASADEEAIKEGELGKDPQLDRALELLRSWPGIPATSVAAAPPVDRQE